MPVAQIPRIAVASSQRDATTRDAREWSRRALQQLRQEAARSADTHLLHLAFPGFPGIDFYFKDESAHATGSLKHRLARSLFLCALCNGRLQEGQTVVDASSRSTAISEAWFARLLGLSFIAVMPTCTAPRKDGIQPPVDSGGIQAFAQRVSGLRHKTLYVELAWFVVDHPHVHPLQPPQQVDGNCVSWPSSSG